MVEFIQRHFLPTIVSSVEGLDFHTCMKRKKKKNYACSENHKLPAKTTNSLHEIKEKYATLVPNTVKLLYRQTKKAQSERSNRVPEGGKKSQRDWSTSLKQARARTRHRHCRVKLTDLSTSKHTNQKTKDSFSRILFSHLTAAFQKWALVTEEKMASPLDYDPKFPHF